MKLDQIGKYKIVAKIGQGATGEVFRAHDPILNRFVAIKTLSAALGADEDRLKRFRREAQSAAKLNHPNIITVYDFGEEQGHLYMAMELLEGRDLSDVIRGGELGLEEAVGLIEQICDAVAFAHAGGVVHRDLKPANIHVLADGQVKVRDFGLARLGGSSEMTRAGAVMGTPNYMAPEQVRGERVDSRADVFSLGAVFHEMLSGTKAFDADSLHGVLYKVLDEAPPPLRLIVPGVPPSLSAFVERALDKDPSRRFRDAGEMRTALRRWRDLDADLESTIAGGSETLSDPGAGPATTVLDPGSQPSHPSLARSRTQPPLVSGATALSMERAAAARTESRLRDLTPRPPGTLSGRSATRVEEGRPAGSRGVLYTGIAVVGLVVVAGLVVLGVRRWNERPATPDVSREQAGVLTEALVDSRIELARVDLQNESYEGAISQAQQALAVQADNAAARAVIAEARKRIAERDAAAAEARSAYQKGDLDAASQALGRLLALDPRHPAAGELSAALNQRFTKQAEDARRAMLESRAAAERMGPSLEGMSEASSLARDAEKLLGDRQYAVATQKFLECRDAFERARRAGEAAAAKARAAAVRPSEPVARPLAPSAAPPTLGTLPPASANPLPSPPAPTLPSAAPPHAGGQEAAIRGIIADYVRAIESKDVGLFKTVKPNLSGDEEKRLTESFKAIKSQKVGITVDAVQVDGGRATVRIHRQDTINGKETRSNQQTFTLVLAGGAWHIESIGQ
jgi:serine/threonine protein kinase/tetratricopeptide (TPR) repeat protein